MDYTMMQQWGLIPTFLDLDDPRPAAEQFDGHYQHGGGWRPFKGFTLDLDNMLLKYKGEEDYRLVSAMLFRDERILLFPNAWVVIVQKDGAWEVSRMD